MSVERKIVEELRRFNEITSYILKEQPAPPAGEDPLAGLDLGGDAGAAPPADPAAPPADPAAPPADPAAGATPPAGGTEIPEPIDVDNDPDVEVVSDTEGKTDEEGGGETEEIDITDLVTTQQDIKTKQEEFMDSLFTKLDDLQSKLSHMDQIMDKINSLENKFDKYREKTPEEKLMLRSLDSYPYNQKLTDFFDDKKVEMDQSGKNEYVLTSDEVENFSPNEIKGTFNAFDEEEEKIEESYKRRKRRI
jgi:fructose-specific phosphotransferase system component IIB